jgi:hypothetical protein
MSNKTKRDVEIIHMEKALVSHKYDMEIIGHKDPISYEKKDYYCFFFGVLQLFLFLTFYPLFFFFVFASF